MIFKDFLTYKYIEEVKGGSFTNDKGKVINYKGFFKLHADILLDNKPKEIILRIPQELGLNLSTNCKSYDKLEATFEILVYGYNKFNLRVKNIVISNK